MKRVFAVAAHPDDIEFLMAGTLIRLGRAGYELHYMNLANGCCGTTQYSREKIAAMRLEEAQNAAARIGAVFHPPIAHDLEIFYDKPTLARLAAVMREVAPDIVLTHAPVDYMEDHTNACRLAVTAAFCRGMPNFPVQPHAVHVDGNVTIYHAQPYSSYTPLRELVRPDIFVDTTDVLDEKMAMLAEHKSQKDWLDESQGLDSYLATLRNLDQRVGAMSHKFEYAEGWRRHLHLGFCDENDDPLSDAIGSWAMDGSE